MCNPLLLFTLSYRCKNHVYFRIKRQINTKILSIAIHIPHLCEYYLEEMVKNTSFQYLVTMGRLRSLAYTGDWFDVFAQCNSCRESSHQCAWKPPLQLQIADSMRLNNHQCALYLQHNSIVRVPLAINSMTSN